MAGSQAAIAQPNSQSQPRLAQANSSRQAEADRTLKQAIDLFAQNNYAAALQAAQTAVTLYRELNDRKNEGEAIRQTGRAYYALKNDAKALEAFQQSLAIAREVKNRDSEGRSLGNLGLIYESLKQPDKAIELYRQSIQIAQEIGDLEGAAINLENLGIVYRARSDFGKTQTAFQQSLALWRQLKNKSRESSLLLTLGNFYASWSGNCSTAIERYEESLPLLRELKNRSGEGIALGGIGRCYEAKGESEKAIPYLQQSIAIAREVKNRRNEGIGLADLAKSYQSLDEKANNRWKHAVLSNDFSRVPQSIQYATQARQVGLESLKIAQELHDRSVEALALATLGRTYAVLGEYQRATTALEQRLTLVRELGDKMAEAETRLLLGHVHSARRDHANAIANHQAAIAIYRSLFTDASGKGRPPRQALMDLGDAYEKSGDYAKAIQAYQESFPQDRLPSSFGSFDIALWSKMGQTFAKWGKLSEAASMLRMAIDKEEVFRTGLAYGTSSTGKETSDRVRIELAERQAEDYRQLQQVLVRQNRIETALEVAEEARARTFVELLSSRITGQPLGKTLPPAPKLDAIRQVAKTQKATLVQYSVVSPTLLYIWVIKPTGEIRFRSAQLDAREPIEQLVGLSRVEMGVRGRPGIQTVMLPDRPPANQPRQSNLAKLHQILIDPIAQDLPSDPNQRVVFLPQGSLFLVPFAALPNAQGKYLIERHTIGTAPSVQTLELTRLQAQKTKSNGKVVLVGDPKMPLYGGTPLTPLPGARQEAIAIGKLLNVTPLIGEQATKAEVVKQMQSASVIHLATHGLLDPIEGDVPGAIALAPSGRDNGFLSASEIFDLKLNAHLVVLSACDTGRGKITGDGVVGLARSLVAAGAPSVLVSLWAVNDASTSYLMREFYRSLQQQPDKAQALRQAMLMTMKEYPNPSYWAAFTLMGESQ